MNFFKIILCLTLLTCFATESYSQFTIAKDESSKFRPGGRDTIKRIELESKEYFSLAKWEADKLKARKERNYIEFTPKFSLNPINAEYWTAGGVNSVTGFIHLYFKHIYTNNRFSLTYWFDAKYGLNVIDSDVFKNLDEFTLNFQPTWKIKGLLSYAITSNIRSQFSKSYASRESDEVVSEFMSPAIIDLSGGFKYGETPFNTLSVTLSPIAGRVVVVASDTLSRKGTHGVDKDKHTKLSLGASLDVQFDKWVIKDRLRIKSHFYGFSDITTNHTGRWKNTVEVKAMKVLFVSLYVETYYDNLAETPQKTQLAHYSSLNVGFTYTFKNK